MRTIGEFYREEILVRDDLMDAQFPENDGEAQVVKDLFGWKLYSGKNFIECRSEYEARYLKVFFDAGMMEVKIPKDDNYLKKITPELELLKSKIDDIINRYIDTVMNRKIREKVRHEVYQEITK